MMRTVVCLIGLLCIGLALSAHAAPKLIGNLDGISRDSSGSPLLFGWACVVGSADSVKIDLYVNQEYPAGHLVGRFGADKVSESSVAKLCATNGSNYRFSIPLKGLAAGSILYAYVISPTGEAGPLLSGSGNLKVPDNSISGITEAVKTNQPLLPGSVTTATPFVLYDATVDVKSTCAPFLDAPIYAVSFPADNHHEFAIWLNAVSPANDGNNYWIKGRMTSDGAETVPLHADCKSILGSPHDPDELKYSGAQWLAGFYKESNGELFGIVHNEYYGGNFPVGFDFKVPATARCSLGVPVGNPVNPLGCTYTTLSITVLKNGSSAFSMPKVIAVPGFKFVPNVGKATGYFTNTNILKGRDGYYYVMTVDVLADGSERRCPIRTSDLSNPSSWKGWDGSNFTVEISKGGDCATTGVSLFPTYLGYNSYFDKYIIVGSKAGHVAYAISNDLIHWSETASFGVPMFDVQTADWSSNNYPSLIDPLYLQRGTDGNESTSAVTGQSAWLVFIQHKRPRATRALAVPIRFQK